VKEKKNKIAFCTFGCKLNYAESSALAADLRENGYLSVNPAEDAEIVVINTCAVTARAEKKCKQAIHRIHKTNPGATIIVTGCSAQLNHTGYSSLPGVKLVLGVEDKYGIINALESLPSENKTLCNIHPVGKNEKFIIAHSLGERTRSFLKIQDGCDYHCNYCTIPLARGSSRSATIRQTMEQINRIAGKGVREIILTGVNIGDFGRRHNESLTALIGEIIRSAPQDIRYRLSSIEPDLLTTEMIDAIAGSDVFARHFHIPLQSACNNTLKAMGRRYNIELFRILTDSILNKMPQCCIGIDIITGFPGETDEDFETTYSFIQTLGIGYMHVFPFSPRPGTNAWTMKNTVNSEKKEQRSRLLLDLSEKKRNEFYMKNMNRHETVIVESKHKDGMLTGYTGNYIKVAIPYKKELIGQIVDVHLAGVNQKGMMIGNQIKIKR